MHDTAIMRKPAWLDYVSIWSERSHEKRLALLKNFVAENCVYTDPNVQKIGHSELSGYIEDCQKLFPGLSFETLDFEEHHDRSLARWNMLSGTKKAGSGSSFVKYDSNGKPAEMTGFFSPPGR